MRNLIIILYFIFLFRLAIAESLPNLPGLENSPSSNSAFDGVPSLDDEFTSKEYPEQEYKKAKEWVNPDNKNNNNSISQNNSAPQITPPSLDNFANDVSEEELPTIKLPQNNAQATKLPEPKISDPYAKIAPDFNPDELTSEEKPISANQSANQNSAPLIRNSEPQNSALSEQFPDTPDLDFSEKRKEAPKTKELSAEEREKQVDELLNSVIGKNEAEEKINPEDLLEKTEGEAQPQENISEPQQPIAQDFNNIRRRVGHSSVSFTEQQLNDQLVRAAMIGDKNSVIALLHSGRSANAMNKFGETPLMGSVFNAHNDIVEILLAEGANPNLVDIKGNTPLHVAVASRNYIATQQLLRAGAKVDFRNNSNDTPLLIATLNNSLDVIDLLVREGADVNKSNSDGLTPLHIAAYNNNIEIVKYLLYVGANADMVTRDGLKPYDLAYGRNFDIARLLVSYTGPQRYVSNDIQNIIKQKNEPIYTPQPAMQTADQFSMFPKSYIEAEEKTAQEAQNLSSKQAEWWASKQAEAQENSAQNIANNSVYNKTSTIAESQLQQSQTDLGTPNNSLNNQLPNNQNLANQNMQATPASMNYPAQNQPAQPSNFSNEIYLDSNQINQTPRQAPASIRMKNYQGSSLSSAELNIANNISQSETFGGSIDTKQARTILFGGTIKYSEMSDEQKAKWDIRLEKWIRKAANLTAINQDVIQRYKRQGKILQSIYREQFGMNIERIRQKMSTQKLSKSL